MTWHYHSWRISFDLNDPSETEKGLEMIRTWTRNESHAYNPMVLAIGIGVYDELKATRKDIDHCSDLDEISADHHPRLCKDTRKFPRVKIEDLIAIQLINKIYVYEFYFCFLVKWEYVF